MKTEIPSWMREVASDSTVSAKDLVPIVGLSNVLIKRLAREGKFPHPDRKVKSLNQNRHPKLLWKVSTIIKYLSEQK